MAVRQDHSAIVLRYVGAYSFGMGAGFVAAHLDGKVPDWPLSLMICGLGAATLVVGYRLGHGPTASRIANLEAAMRLARRWGVSSRGYSGRVAVDLADWIDGGMHGPAPAEPYPERSAPRGRANVCIGCGKSPAPHETVDGPICSNCLGTC